MCKKIISRQKLDQLIELVRELNDSVYDEANVDRIVKSAIGVARDIEEDNGPDWNGVYDYVWSILRSLKLQATNEELYKGLEMFGWEVQDEA